MKTLPDNVAAFLDHNVIAVVGVSRGGWSPANAILKKLRSTGHTVFAVNPNAAEIGGERCWPDVLSLPEKAGAAVIVTKPEVAGGIVRQCAEAGILDVWLHRSVGGGSVSDEAARECGRLGIRCIAGGCPMMYAGSVDVAHACMRTILGWRKRVPV
jgi:predicted CoA-binding protein